MLLAPAAAGAYSSHSQLHTCCTDPATKDAMFREAKASGAAYIRLDIEMHGVFTPGPFGIPLHDWTNTDDIARLSRRYRLPVLAILLGSPDPAAACAAPPPARQRICAPRDPVAWGATAGDVAARYRGVIKDFEIWNEPDGAEAFAGTPEDYGRMLSASYDRIKARAPGSMVVLGGTKYPTATGEAWLARAFAAPGTEAIRKFDIGSIHLRGRIPAMVGQLRRRRAFLAGLGRDVAMWVTEHGYASTARWQRDPAYRGGARAQADYLARSLPALEAAGAQQTFVTLRDASPGEYESEGILQGQGRPGGAFVRKPAFRTVQRAASAGPEPLPAR